MLHLKERNQLSLFQLVEIFIGCFGMGNVSLAVLTVALNGCILLADFLLKANSEHKEYYKRTSMRTLAIQGGDA